MRTRGSPGHRRGWYLLLIPVLGVAVVGQLSLVGSAASAAAARPVTGASVAPNPVNELDCNGWSAKYGTVRKLAGDLCTDPGRIVNGKIERFDDNGWYVGHDEPSVKFISNQPGSGNTMTYIMKLAKDPRRMPTSSGSVTDYGQLSIAPWFGLPVCDPKSFPQNPCAPDSDSNIGSFQSPAAAGSAFMELQFYAPGFTPFVDNQSCSATKWCAALTIDSLECSGKNACNANCTEPINFAYLQTNGVPAGPPSPQLTDVSTFTPNGNTLFINPGDVVVVSISDPPQGFTAVVRDLTTGQTGFMTASAANGFMNTSFADCSGSPYTFHAEYNTARIQNQVPWALLEGGVLMEQEIGHSEVCTSLANQDPFSMSYPGGQSFSDPSTYDTCVGGSEGPNSTGEGPCSPTTGICQNATTQGPDGPVACPTNNPATGALCEFADAYCFPKGVRTTMVNGVPTPAVSRANQCDANRYQNGDLDFDGLSYQSFAWPDGSRNRPTAFQYIGPFTDGGHTYPQIQFESDIGGSSNLCKPATGAGCTVPPISADFYPFWSLSPLSRTTAGDMGRHFAVCVWNFGNDLPDTVADFGRDAQYGTPDVARFGGTIISAPMPNPQFAGGCRSHRDS